MSSADPAAEAVVVIPSSCDADMAPGLLADLRATVGQSGEPRWVDLSEGRPTALALQLLASTARSLALKSAFAGYGPAGAQALSSGTGGVE